MKKKYDFTGETIHYEGITLRRIVALRSFGDVKKGDIGGWIQKESNLSHRGRCWVYDNARVYGYGDVSGWAQVRDNAQVLGDGMVMGKAVLRKNTKVGGMGGVGWVVGGIADPTGEKANNSNPALFEKALEICEKAHAGQFRRDGITPYAVHPKAVAKILSNKDEHIRAVALLHDVLEDTDMTAKDLLDQGIPERIVEAVKLLSKRPEDTYDTFIDRLLESKDYMARTVKIADIIANLQDSPTEKQVKKYSKALERLVLDELYTQRI